ncbi:MAG: hypothetical protein Kow00122_15460 [Thermoleophilia bacterium]
MISQLEAASGLCARHTRRLLRTQVSEIINTVYLYVVPAALRRLTSAEASAPARCPACEAVESAERNARSWLLDSLNDPDVSDAYARRGGFCRPHALSALAEAPVSVGRLIGQVLRERGRQDRCLPFVAGTDSDAPLRRRLREILPLEEWDQPTTLGRLRARFQLDCCPICHALGQMERRYLAWALSEGWAGAADQLSSLCPRHLHDVAHLDSDLAAGICRWQAEQVVDTASGFVASIDALPPASFSARLRQLVESRRRPGREDARPQEHGARAKVRRAAHDLFQSRGRTYRHVVDLFARPSTSCPACRALASTEQRQLELLLRGLQDTPTAAAYETSHGVCFRHALALNQPTPLLRNVVSARLALLGWELDEASRKRSWSLRHEPTGPEASAWFRTPAAIDGRSYLGGVAAPSLLALSSREGSAAP